MNTGHKQRTERTTRQPAQPSQDVRHRLALDPVNPRHRSYKTATRGYVFKTPLNALSPFHHHRGMCRWPTLATSSPKPSRTERSPGRKQTQDGPIPQWARMGTGTKTRYRSEEASRGTTLGPRGITCEPARIFAHLLKPHEGPMFLSITL